MIFNKENYANNCMEIINSLHNFYISISDNKAYSSLFTQYLSDDSIEEKTLISYMIYVDVVTCVEKSGHNAGMISTESIPVKLLFYYFLEQNNNMSIEAFFDSVTVMNVISDLVKQIKNMPLYTELTHGSFNISNVLENGGKHLKAYQYIELLYNLANNIAVADDDVTAEERTWIKLLRATKKTYKLKADDEKKTIMDNFSANHQESSDSLNSFDNATTSNCSIEELTPIEELKELIGLESVKEEVSNLNNLLKMQKLRESRGLKATQVSYHCIFTGNPGTGKTTVARILARIYKELGIIKRGQLIETDRSGLVAEYVGQTAVKTNAIIDSALDGVLFIDEAYSLVQGGPGDFGKEAISTLLKRMEDDRERLIVILAGYSREMEDFINSNSGLQSRFSRYINFPDYDIEELNQIFNLQLAKNQYVIDAEAKDKVWSLIENDYNQKDQNFGNARYVRNLFERIISNQSNRLATMGTLSDDMLMRIVEQDIY